MAPTPVAEGQDQEANEDGTDNSLAKSRSRREKKDKGGRLAALAKLKKAKQSGERLKYEFQEEENVYEDVDESEYSNIVRKRQEDDWIVDDDGGGYVEDGREIFDDEVGAEPVSNNNKEKKDKQSKKKNANIRAPGAKPTNIKGMFMAAKAKKVPEKKNVKLDDDDLLGDIMAELKSEPSSVTMKPVPVKAKKLAPAKAPYNPFAAKPVQKTTMAPTRRPAQKRPEPERRSAPPTKVKRAPKAAPKKEVYEEPEEEESPEIEEYATQMEVDEEEDDTEIEDASQAGPSRSSQGATSMDVTDIDFDDDDDFGQSEAEKVKVNGHVKEEVKKENKVQEKRVEFQRAGWDVGESSEVVTDVQVDSSQLPLTTNEEGEQILRMFWFDTYEDPYKMPGVVYLFGKVWIESAKVYVSCTLAVKNIDKRMYLLPRANKFDLKTASETDTPVSMVDVYQEFNENICSKYKIPKFKSRKVTKKYAFEKSEVPVESDYLEVRYAAELPQLPIDLKGETFSHAFGTNTSSLEVLLIDRKMRGPGWIDIKLPQIQNPAVSWCKVEAFVTNPNHISVSKCGDAPPPVIIMTLNMKTVPNPKTHQNEIIAVSSLVHTKFHIDKPAPKDTLFQQHFCAVSKPNDCIFPYDFRDKANKQAQNMKIEVMGGERALLGFLLAKIHKVDPDVIVGHDIYGFDLDVLLHRVSINKIPHWSRIGRLRRANMPKLSGPGKSNAHGEKNAACGRMICDVKISARELIRCRSYDLTALTDQLLKQKRQEIDPDQIKQMYNSSQSLLHLVELCLVDSRYILQMMYELNVLPLALQITNICGNVMSRTLMGGRSERNEYLLLHAFQDKDFIVPDKEYKKKQAQASPDGDEDEDREEGKSKKASGRRKPAYAGGLVLEPKKGFYDKYILLLDFNSLYPSIIQEYNICFTTIARSAEKKTEQGEEEEDMNVLLPEPDLEAGILPTEIRKLVQSRQQVKSLMKNTDNTPEMNMQYDIRQKALKLTANSMYGCLGFSFSRFYAKPLAALVTGKGREILMKTKDLVEAMNLDVIYGDTDSIMINTNSTDLEQVYKLGNKVKNEVNKLYRLLEIDIDGVFKSMLLLKKKKYAALNMTKVGDKYVCNQELKGLDIVRRDWCMLAKEAGNYVISQILSGDARESIVENIHTKLQEVGEQVRNGEIPEELYHITKQLTKNPEDYPDKKNQSHVQVALRINSKGGRKMRAGDTVYYIICQDGSTMSASQRAYSPEELQKADNLTVDVHYYLANQIHPVVSRLCDPIDGTDTAHIAECLGLDPSGYRHAMRQNQDDDEEAMLGAGQVSDEEKYRNCDRLKYICPNQNCRKEIIFDSAFTGTGNYIQCTLAQCTNPQCTTIPHDHVAKVMNRLAQAIRKDIKKYYEGWMKCEDSACNARTRKMPLMFHRGHPICQACTRGILHPEYTDSQLYTQLSFYQYMFDLEKCLTGMTEGEKVLAKRVSKPYEGSYLKLKSLVGRHIRESAYSEVNLNKLFHGLALTKQ